MSVRIFRKKPVTIQAIRFVGENLSECRAFCRGFVESGAIVIPTLEGLMRAEVGDWIIRGINGEYYPCKPGIFSKTYEEVES